MEKKLWIECACRLPDHTIRFVDEQEEDFPLIYLEIQLTRFGFFRRLWKGIKYILGIRDRWGHWDEVLLDREAVKEISYLFNDFLRRTEKD